MGSDLLSSRDNRAGVSRRRQSRDPVNSMCAAGLLYSLDSGVRRNDEGTRMMVPATSASLQHPLHRALHQLGTALQIELGSNILPMSFDGVNAEV